MLSTKNLYEDIDIRECCWHTQADSDRIADMYPSRHLKSWSLDDLLDLWHSQRVFVFVADGYIENNGRAVKLPVIAYSVVEQHNDALALARIVVQENWQRQGVGTRLMQHFLGGLSARKRLFMGHASVSCAHDKEVGSWLMRFNPCAMSVCDGMTHYRWCAAVS